jgi:hypothetical protein
VAKADEVLKPLLLACDSNNPKMIAIGVGSIQKLIAQNAVSEARADTTRDTRDTRNTRNTRGTHDTAFV